ncbi:MAG: SDR family NAD(P)-dependent oxidoreductase [Pseudomonadota bacterium]
MNSMMRDKVALVTGAARGIGAEVASMLIAEGFFVYATDLDTEGAQASARRLGVRAVGESMDVRNPQAVRAVVSRIVEEREAVDILVNNAGIISSTSFLAAPEGLAESVFQTNFWGAVHCCRAVLPIMRARRRGKVINIASVSAMRGGGAIGDIMYGASKAAIVAFTQGLGREMAPYGVNVNAIAPGLLETDMTRPYLTETTRPMLLKRFPRGRLAVTADIANAVRFLVSDAADYIVGATLAVDGGFLQA